MMQLKLALHSLTHNVQRYALFILSSTLLIAVNFIFLSILQNKSILDSDSGLLIKPMMIVGFVFIALITVTFMFYANGFLIRDRNHELGVYNILGMTRGDLDFIVLIQNTIMYVISLIAGLISGITFLELAFIALRNLLNDNSFKGTVDLLPIFEVAALFLGIYILMMSFDIFKMSRLNPINLLKSANKAATEPKSHWILGLLGISSLMIGYYLSVTTPPRVTALLTFIAAVILVVVGTYLVFITGSIVILKALRKNKKFYYKSNHFISVSGMLFRMKQNGAGLASICLLVTSTLVVLVASISLFSTSHKVIENSMPYDMIAIQSDKMNNSDVKKIHQIAKRNDVKVGKIKGIKAVVQHGIQVSGNNVQTIMENDDYLNNQEFANVITVADYNNWTGKHVTLNNHEVLYYSKNFKLNDKKLNINHKVYQARQIKDFKFPESNLDPASKKMYLVVNNQAEMIRMFDSKQHFTQQIEQTSSNKLFSKLTSYIYAYDLKGSLKNKTKFSKQLNDSINHGKTIYQAKPEIETGMKAFLGSFLFVGALIGIVMSITTALIIYYKQVSEGVADRGNFETMQRVGLSYAETKKSIHNQVLMVFMLPIMGAIINLGFAYPALREIFKLIGMWNQKIFLIVSLIVTLVLIICYICIYLLTAKVYQRIVNK